MAKRTTHSRPSSDDKLIDLAGPVSDRVQIQHVILAETIARRQPVYTGPPAELALHVDVTTVVKEQDRFIQVRPRFTLVGRDAADKANEMLRIEALFVVQYNVPSFDGITTKNIDAFGKTNGIFNAWPYWREFVQSMTVRMGLPPLIVPVYRPLASGIGERPHSDSPPTTEAVSAHAQRRR